MFMPCLLLIMMVRCATSQTQSETAMSCHACCQGPAGPRGDAGIPGSHGTHGIPGAIGSTGEAGNTGIRGEAGPIGLPGHPGESGDKGERGEPQQTGLPGKLGPVGSPGVPGAKGVIGSSGSKGEPGAKGEQNRIDVSYRSAFTAIKTAIQTGNSGDVVIFERLVADIGNDFSASTGKFTCRVAGVYVFTFNLNTEHTSIDTDVVLKKNIDAIIGAARDHNSNKDGGISGTAVIPLAVGDQVWIEMYEYHNQVVHFHRENAGYSNFSGFLLYEG